MMWVRHLLRCLTLAAACLLVSCIDGREEIWIKPDGSGRAEFRYSLPAAAAKFHGGEAGVRRMIGDFLKATPQITISRLDVLTADGRLVVQLNTAFDSVLDLMKISGNSDAFNKLPSSASGLSGQVRLAFRGRSIDFSRTIAAGEALPGAAFLPDSQFEGRRLCYIFHLPGPAIDTNATRIEDGGRTLIWDFPVAEAIRKPIRIKFTARIPIPLWAVAAVACLSAGAGWVILRLFRRRSRRCDLDSRIDPP